MATSNSQRITIWVIAIMMSIGSIGFYFLIILENDKQAKQRAELQKLIAEQDKPTAAKPLPGFAAAPFKAESVTQLVKEDVKAGSGAAVASGATVTVNYMGWLPDGTIFDSSNRGEKPEPVPLSLNAVIDGWKQGIPGMKTGGVRKLVIPAEQAYGTQGSPPSIPPNTPLTFIVEVTGIEKS